jgi:uncharacterized DUF497 family protein
VLLFEWDAKKSLANLKKHGVSFEDASTVFADPNALTIPDELHSKNEARELTIGTARSTRILVVSHTDRHNRIRIISARKATKKELKQYQELV